MLAHADGIESEKGAIICGTLDLPRMDSSVLPGVATEQLTLLFEFEARNGFKTDILKYIKIGFAGGRVPTTYNPPPRRSIFLVMKHMCRFENVR